jgi:cytochrome c
MTTARARSATAAVALIAALTGGVALAQDVAKGADVFQDHCSQCHVLTGVGQGPSLLGVVDRRAASLPSYPYSDGLKASGLTWTRPNLDLFISGPTKLVPGTSMRAVVSDPSDRRALIAYLATLKR